MKKHQLMEILCAPALLWIFIIGRIIDYPWTYIFGVGPKAPRMKKAFDLLESLKE